MSYGTHPAVTAYGYAFIKDRYLPHITLGFDSRLSTGDALAAMPAHAMTAARVVPVRFGPFGRVDAVLSL